MERDDRRGGDESSVNKLIVKEQNLIIQHRSKIFNNRGKIPYQCSSNNQRINFMPIPEKEQCPEILKNFQLLPKFIFRVLLPPLNLGQILLGNIEQFYVGYVMDFVVIDEPFYHPRESKIELLVQDHKNFIGRVVISDFPQIANLNDLLGYGCRFVITNPYFNGQYLLMDAKEIIYFPKRRDIARCRACGEPGSLLVTCSNCEKVFYCNRECQAYDWYVLKHKFICF